MIIPSWSRSPIGYHSNSLQHATKPRHYGVWITIRTIKNCLSKTELTSKYIITADLIYVSKSHNYVHGDQRHSADISTGYLKVYQNKTERSKEHGRSQPCTSRKKIKGKELSLRIESATKVKW